MNNFVAKRKDPAMELSVCCGSGPNLDRLEVCAIEESDSLQARRKNRWKVERTVIRDIGLLTAVFTIVVMVLVAAYQLRATQNDLAYDLNATFANYHK